MMRSIPVLLTALATLFLIMTTPQPAHAQSGVDPEFLAEIQGRWVSRFPGKNHAVEIRGNEVRVVVADPSLKDGATPGTVVAIITGIKERRADKSLVNGRTIYNFDFEARRWTTDGRRYFLSDQSYRYNGLTTGTTFCRDTPSSFSKPFSEQRFLSGMWGGEMMRQEEKDKIFPPNDPRPNWADPIVPKCTAAAGRRSSAAPSTPSRPSAAATVNRATAATSEQPAPPPGPSAQQLAEIAEQERLNREQADFATRQLAENIAAKAAFDKATAEREATIARQQAEAQRNQAEYAAAMAKWRADVEACKQGDFSRCAPPQ